MKRGKRFLENENLIIYVGTAIFFILAISIGIIMYMTTKTNTKIGKENNIQEIQKVEESTENASTSIGKTVEEQENSMQSENRTSETNTAETTNKTSSNTETKTSNTITNTTSNTNSNTNAQLENKNTESEAKVTETKKEITFIKPVEGEIIAEFAKENLIYSETLKEWITHTAIDIKTDKTSVIKSAAAGTIKSIVNDPRYGLTVVIEHDDGYETVYSNLLTAEFVVEGEEVEQGQTIGTAGTTASFESGMECHLHFELLKDGEYLDPNIYLK